MQQETCGVLGRGHEGEHEEAHEEAHVVVVCSRCPREAKRDVATQRWSILLVSRVSGAAAKQLLLCTECSRTFRQFMLGAVIGRDAGETWEQIIAAQVRS